MMEFEFEQMPWEQQLEQIPDGGSVDATQLLAMTEQASEEQLEETLCLLRERHISLVISEFPNMNGDGEAATRLRMEQKLVTCEDMIGTLPEGDPLRLYLEELSLVPVCGDPALLAQAVVDGDIAARERLVELLLGRAVSLAKEYTGKGVLLLDLIQDAGLGLWEGLLSFTGGDVEKHCDWWMHQYLIAAVLRQARALGIGQKLRQAMEDYRSVDERLLADLGRNPTTEEIAEALHITPAEAELVADMVSNARNLKRAKQPEPEQLPQEEDQAVEDTAYFQMRQRVRELLSGLSEEDARLVSMRYGLDGGEPMDPAQAGIKLGLTAQEVINREAAALAKLRQ